MNIENPIRAKLIGNGFKRHIGLFGQSGSGKSFALAILLEELHLNTGANIIVFDLNGDFVQFKESLRRIEEINHRRNKYIFNHHEIKKYQKLHNKKRDSVKVLSTSEGQNIEPIVIRFCDLDEKQQSHLLNIDPLQNWQLFSMLSEALEKLREKKPNYNIDDMLSEAEMQDERLVSRIKSSGLEKLRIWGNSESDEIPLINLIGQDDLQTIIIDLSNLTRIERFIVCNIIFERIWDIQIERKQNNMEQPCFLLVDEAHNLFPAKPLFSEQESTLEWGIRIAGEGRKFGLYLLACSQLPSKIHEYILTQCGNLILMKMLSQSDLNVLQNTFSFVPETFMEMSISFSIGDALIAGNIVSSPLLVHFEGRKTQEGGSDFKLN